MSVVAQQEIYTLAIRGMAEALTRAAEETGKRLESGEITREEWGELSVWITRVFPELRRITDMIGEGPTPRVDSTNG